MRDIYRLTHDVYVAEGYCAQRPDGLLIHYPRLDGIENTHVIGAYDDGVLVGTNSWKLDGPEGLHVDDDFPSETERVRREGRRLGASWRIVTAGGCRNNRRVLLRIVGRTVRNMLDAGIETALFTFHPKHETAYARLLNMTTVATCCAITALDCAPAVLMRLDAEDVPRAFSGRKYGSDLTGMTEFHGRMTPVPYRDEEQHNETVDNFGVCNFGS